MHSFVNSNAFLFSQNGKPLIHTRYFYCKRLKMFQLHLEKVDVSLRKNRCVAEGTHLLWLHKCVSHYIEIF